MSLLSKRQQTKFRGCMDEALISMVETRHIDAIRSLQAAIAILVAVCGTTKDDREDITGISTRGKNKNFGNSGFSGGCTQPAGYAGG